ncbi:L-histidine N(alpha)-methyltransferase [Pedobacter sp. AW1-32]|uniref:L-histidine N(alpha)-methyltransferase n=1 Tax=Pedobacter sp. AW1-32 TaxID=3383026 RepID=UPI003FEE8E9C
MSTLITETPADNKTKFLEDTLQGLRATPKTMQSKYFYDEKGDQIFQQIMDMEEYYLTNCEMEIMQNQAGHIAEVIAANGDAFDLIELGAGDATKSVHLLKALLEKKVQFTYLPIDISAHVISDLEVTLPKQLPELDIFGLNGDYFDMLEQANLRSNRRKVVLFMGANIGNMTVAEAEVFCEQLRAALSVNDTLIVGFDLKKNPQQILNAYNDQRGITRAFNLNLLQRMNRELEANFELEHFEHYATYDPASGACKSYLISLKQQTVIISGEVLHFAANEYIFMEISQKYDLSDIDALAQKSGFKPARHFFDRRNYFVDAIWEVQ